MKYYIATNLDGNYYINDYPHYLKNIPYNFEISPINYQSIKIFTLIDAIEYFYRHKFNIENNWRHLNKKLQIIIKEE